MVILQGLETSITELKTVINEYKVQLKRMNIREIDSYPIIINIYNDNGQEDGWRIDTKKSKKSKEEDSESD